MASKVHRIRFYNPKPLSINCASYNETSKVVAVARADASIEIWTVSHAPYLIKYIPGVENGSIEAIGWVNYRLLSTGLGGALVEWDLNNLSLKRTVLLTGYAAWCLDVNTAQTLVAVGTEQGYVNLYSVENEDIEYRKLFDKQEGRILCCKFDKTGNILVTGSTNTIRVWNVATGQATTRISTNRRGKESIVWSLGVFSDNTIVSGEGHGRLTFWDITTGDQIESYTTHKQDILSIVVSEKEDKLYCSGVDPVIVQFVKVASGKDQTKCVWTKHVQIHNHEHDVRCLALQGDKLISVGVDGYLTFSSYPPKWTMRIPPLLPQPRTFVSAEKRLLLLKFSNHLEVWRLGSHASNEKGEPVFKTTGGSPDKNPPRMMCKVDQNGDCDYRVSESELRAEFDTDLLKIADAPLKLVSVQTKGNKPIRCCALSPNGEFIVYSTDTHVRMLKLEIEEDGDLQTSLSKVSVSCSAEAGGAGGAGAARGAAGGALLALFTPDSKQCVVALAARRALLLLAVDAGAGAAPVQTLPTDKHLKEQTVTNLHVSRRCASGASYLAAGGGGGAVAVWARGGRAGGGAGARWAHHADLPAAGCAPTALTVDTRTDVLYVVYVDQKVVEYDLVNRKFLSAVPSRLPPEWFSRAAAVSGVAVHPAKDALVFTDDNTIWVLDRNAKETVREEPAMKKRLYSSSEGNSVLRAIPIKYLSGFHWLSAREAVLVEAPPEHILLQLPPALRTNTSYRPPQ